MSPAVFLDRDGVLNRAIVRNGRPYAPRVVADFEVLPGVGEACERLRDAGFMLIVVTNQPELATGLLRPEDLDAMHARLNERLSLDGIKVCPHIDADGCACRKPKPGMLLEAAAEHDIDLARSVMVGDRWRDVEAGRAAGCTTIWLKNDYDEPRPAADAEFDSLPTAANWLIEQTARRREPE